MDRHADARAESFRFSQMLPAQEGSQLDEVTLAAPRAPADAQGRRTRASVDPRGLHLLRPVRRPRPELRHDGARAGTDAGRRGAAAGALARRSTSTRSTGTDRSHGRPGRFYADGDRHAEDRDAPCPSDDRARVARPRPPARATGRASRGTRRHPDARNDDNLAVAQTHAAFIRFHNRVVATRTDARCARGRALRAAPGASSRGTSSGSSGSTSSAGSATPRVLDDVLGERAEGLRARRGSPRRADDAGRVLRRRRSASGTRWSGARTTGTATST